MAYGPDARGVMREEGTMRGRGMVPGLVIAVAVVATPAVAGPTRRVVGELSTRGDVWTQDVAGGARETSLHSAGAPLLESTRVRTGKGAAALLTLGRDGVLGLR